MSAVHPPDRTAPLQEASAARQRGDHEAARAALDRLLRDAPDDGDGLHMRGALAIARGDATAAIADLRGADANGAGPLALANLGIALAAAGFAEEAESVLRRAVDDGGGQPQAAYNLGHLLAARGADDEAEVWLRAAVDAAPSYTRASCELAAVLLRSREASSAHAVLLAALGYDEDHPVVLHHLGLAERMLGNHEAACAYFRRARPAMGPDRDLMLGLGASLQECGHLEEALAVYRELLGALPDAYGQVLRTLSSAPHGCFDLRPSRLRALLGMA